LERIAEKKEGLLIARELWIVGDYDEVAGSIYQREHTNVFENIRE
jgi:hypothetical protein